MPPTKVVSLARTPSFHDLIAPGREGGPVAVPSVSDITSGTPEQQQQKVANAVNAAEQRGRERANK